MTLDDTIESWHRYYKRAKRMHAPAELAYTFTVEGSLPDGPVALAAAHRSTLDHIALIRGIDRYLSFMYDGKVSTIRKLVPRINSAGGINVRSAAIKKNLYAHLDAGDAVVFFPQGTQEQTITTWREGIFRLITEYEHDRGCAVPVVPTGITYELSSPFWEVPTRALNGMAHMLKIIEKEYPRLRSTARVTLGTPIKERRSYHDLATAAKYETARLSNMTIELKNWLPF